MDNNIENLFEIIPMTSNGENMSTFPIKDLHKKNQKIKKTVFIPVIFSE